MFHDGVVIFACVFFFKQKTAYEMRISDWSSDVCSSDLMEVCLPPAALPEGVAVSRTPIRLPLRHRPARRIIAMAIKGSFMARSEERRVGKECVSTCRSRWSLYH